MQTSQICFPEIGKVVYEKKEADLSAKANEILIRTLYSAISAGTELAKLTGLQVVQYPYIPGSRAVGEILEVGSQVKEFAPGDRVFTHTHHVSHSKSSRFFVKIPDNVDLKYAPVAGLGLVAMTALRIGRPELGDRAAVIGMGIVGNLCAQLLKCAGVEVIAVDVSDARLERALKCGADHAINPRNQDTRAEVMEITGGHGVEYVVEAAGNPATMEMACSINAKQGEVILLGSPRGDYQTDITPLLNAVHLWRDHGSIQLKGAHEWRYPLYPDGYTKHSMARNAAIFFRLMAEGRLNIGELVTHILKPERAAEAYDGLLNKKDEYQCVVFGWTES